MADVSHELGALRFVVDSPLSSKVAMFNNQVQQHKQGQLLNPFSNPDGRASSPKPQFSKDQYGKPLAGSLTEMRGQKANMHVMKEMVELCQIINSEGYDVKDEPTMRVIPFGELFNIYNYISDKVVGILLRARKYKFVEFEGEMLFQRRDDDVPIFLLRPIAEIRHELEAKIDEIKRGASPAPQSTSLLLDKSANEQRLKDLSVPNSQRNSKSRSQSPAIKSIGSTPAASTNVSRAPTPQPTVTSNATSSTTSTPIVVATESTDTKPEKAAPQPDPELKNSPVAPAVPTTASSVATVAVTANDELPTIVIETTATTALEAQPTSATDDSATTSAASSGTAIPTPDAAKPIAATTDAV